MRKSVSAFMALIIFTLSLACTMSFCPIMANASQENVSSENTTPMPCHGDKASEEQSQTPMLSSDCLGVDLFNADQNIDFSPNLVLDPIDFSWANLTALYNLRPQMSQLIRGPPFDASPSYSNSTDLYLTTQRLRI